MKYQENLTQVRDILVGAENILITLVKEPSIDDLAAGLAAYLALEKAGKKVAIATDGVIKVGHSHLFGVNQIQSEVPPPSGGNLTVVLGGVVDPDTQKPTTLQELKWHPEASDLHLVFYPVPGQRFEPTHITPGYEGAKYEVILVIGATTLDDLGAVYKGKPELYHQAHILNIDNKLTNTKFGLSNVIDVNAASLSEIMEEVLSSLGFPASGDAASNILIGIFTATNNLTDPKTSADTFASVAETLRNGGKRPQVADLKLKSATSTGLEQTAGLDLSSLPQSQPTTSSLSFDQMVPAAPAQPISTPKPSLDQTAQTQVEVEPEPSPEEAPPGESIEAVSPESDWLTPKIFKGTSIG